MKKYVLLLPALLALKSAGAQTPKAYFPFNQSLASTVGGYTLSAKTGSASYTPTSLSTNGSHSCVFNGNTQLTTPFKLDSLAKGVSVSFWVKRGSVANESGILVAQLEVHKPSAPVTVYPATFNINLNGGHVYMEWYSSNIASSSLYAADTLNLGWNFITMVWHQKRGLEYNFLLYTNGKLTDSAIATDLVNKDANKIDLTIGAYTTRYFYPPGGITTTTFFKGELDEVKIFESELTAAQVGNFYQTSSASIKSLEMAQIQAYPNPATGNVNLTSSLPITSLKIMNVNGAVLHEIHFNNVDLNRTINISDLPVGMYFIQVAGENMNETVKIIKQ